MISKKDRPNQPPPIWLIGSGASKDAGIPLVGEIDKIVFEEPFFRHTDGRYLRGNHPSAAIEHSDMVVPRVRALLHWSRAMIERARPGQRANYEEVFFFLQEIRDAVSGEYENPALLPIVEKAGDFLLYLNATLARPLWGEMNLAQGTGEACRCIADVVNSALSPEEKNLEVIPALVSCLKDFKRRNQQVVVGTLNHDVLIEEVLKKKRVVYRDGFSRRTRSYRRTFDRLLLNERKYPLVLKLHGSTRWVVIHENGGRQSFSEIVDWEGFDRQRVKNPGLDVLNSQPRILIGTHNKILGYSRPLFWHLFVRFRASLEKSTRLIVVGYGFKDKGINEIIIDWMIEDKGRRMVVVDPFVKDTRDSCRSAVRRKWAQWVNNDQLVEFPFAFSAISWSDLAGVL